MGSKRKFPSVGLERRVRPRREDDDPELGEEDLGSSEEVISEEDVAGSELEENDQSDSDSESSSRSEADRRSAPKIDLSSVSFGALARAQASIGASKRTAKNTKEDDKGDTSSTRAQSSWSSKTDPKPRPPKRSSKHAPQEQTSKKPVSRRREILADPRRQYRDPRFDPVVGKAADTKAFRQAYSFLDDYRDSEMADLRAQIKKTKDYSAKEDLKRQLLSMESKKKARQKKEDEEKLLEDHRKQEKELVAQGKQPFYLKKSEQKKQLLTNRFAKLNKGQVDKAIERKRKKVAGKEKKELGSMQRVTGRNDHGGRR